MLDIFFLGTSAGIPSTERSMPCIALRWAGKVFLFDVGECCQRQMMKAKVGYGSLEAVFISHLHLDHFIGLYGLIETLRMTTDIPFRGLKVHAPAGFTFINRWPFLEYIKIKEGVLHEGSDFEISAFRVHHADIEAYGFIFREKDKYKFDEKKAKALGVRGKMFRTLLERKEIKTEKGLVRLEDVASLVRGISLAYTGDIDTTIGLENKIFGVDVLIADSTFLNAEDREGKAHTTVREVAELAERAKVKTLILTHISARYKETAVMEREAKKYFSGNVIVAKDFLHCQLSRKGFRCSVLRGDY